MAVRCETAAPATTHAAHAALVCRRKALRIAARSSAVWGTSICQTRHGTSLTALQMGLELAHNSVGAAEAQLKGEQGRRAMACALRCDGGSAGTATDS